MCAPEPKSSAAVSLVLMCTNIGLAQEFDNEAQKFQDRVFQQETLLYVAYHLLLHLSEDTRVEIKVQELK